MIETIVLQIVPFADGFPKPQSRAQRRMVAERLVDSYRDGVVRISKAIEDVSRLLGTTPNSYFFDVGRATHLSGQVRQFQRSLILFHIGLMSASTFAEEAHTLVEAVLKACLPPNQRRGSFAVLLDRVAKAAQLPSEHTQTLLRLKDRRGRAKHHGQRVKYADMAADVGDLIAALHGLFRYLRLTRQPEQANKPLQPPGFTGG